MSPEEFRSFILTSFGSNDHISFQRHLRAIGALGFDPLDVFVYVASNLDQSLTDQAHQWVLCIAYRVCQDLITERQASRKHDRERTAITLERLNLLFDSIDET